VEVVVIGAGPAYTDRVGSAGSSYLVREGETALLLDFGQGAFPNLAAVIEPSTLSAVVITHLHPDHFVDLVPLRHYLRYEFDPPRRVAVLGPAGLTARLDGLDGHEGFAAASLDIAALAEGTRRIGSLELLARLDTHTDESYAFRVAPAGRGLPPDEAAQDGAARPGLVYSGDCGRADDLVPLIHPGDTLLCEASFGAGIVPPGASHLTAADAAGAAVKGRAARLLLTHLQMGFSPAEALEAARAVFPGPVDLVAEGDRFEI
jgi:ribonuclease BN (tRNA processing enzyme)